MAIRVGSASGRTIRAVPVTKRTRRLPIADCRLYNVPMPQPSPTVQKWVEQARYDLETARAMLDSGRYVYVVFCCQQAVEKMIKRRHRQG